MKSIRRALVLPVLVLLAFAIPGALPHAVAAVDLLARYPTTLIAADVDPNRARAWSFDEGDLFELTRFDFEGGKTLKIEIGPADVGLGHCEDGVVWAVIVPRSTGRLTGVVPDLKEDIAHVWLRMHPGQVSRLFPPGTVAGEGRRALVTQMSAVARAKMSGSWQAGGRAMIPGPKDLTIDVDVVSGPRRFFVVDTDAGTASYIPAFEGRSLRQPPRCTPQLAEEAFDQLWEAFDREYAGFILRPEVDWQALQGTLRPKARLSATAYELAEVFADLLRPLRDLHVWLTVAGVQVPVFDRPRELNANPAAHAGLIGNLKTEGRVRWGITANQIGYIAIDSWSDRTFPDGGDEILGQLKDTRGLIVDVRLNSGGSEPVARELAARFIETPFVYSLSRVRSGPGHGDLTALRERKVAPRGPWRYDRPVVLLIGQRCMSSNESFIAMMTGAPNVTTLGDRTCGSSGNPRIVSLPLDMTVSIPRWIDYLPDGTPLDERGLEPQARVVPKPGAFEGGRDDVLAAALDRLGRVPLPEAQAKDTASDLLEVPSP